LDDAAEQEAYEFLRQSAPGAVLELPAALDRFERESRYQYLTLVHGHPVVNGQSGYVTPLFSFLAGGQSPFNETGRLGDALSAVRAADVRYLVVHHDAFDDRNVGRAWEDALVAEKSQVASLRWFGPTTIATLQPLPQEHVPGTDRAAIPVSAIRAQASSGLDRLPLLFDGNPETRWLSGAAQRGDEWIALEFDRPRDVAAIRLRMAPRSNGDYPRVLAVESMGAGGARTLFQGSVLPAFVRGLLTSGTQPDIDLALPPNETAVLRLRQLGTARRFFWSIHELQVYER
jgi:hypothetical protein